MGMVAGMSWEWDPGKSARSEQKAPKAAKRLTTGVKHIKQSISGFTHDKPDKAESMLTRLNLRSSDPLSSGGGGGRRTGLTAMDISAAFGFPLGPVGEVERYFSEWATKEFCHKLALYNYTNDKKVYGFVEASAHFLLVQIGKKEGWSNAEKDGRALLTAQRVARVVIEDICHPKLFVDLSDRRWERLLELSSGQKAWQRKWKHRYETLRQCLLELDMAAIEQVKRRV